MGVSNPGYVVYTIYAEIECTIYARTLFYCACANELVVNNGNRGEIMEKLRGELWEGRAVDGKLKSNLEWPNVERMRINPP